MVQIYDFWSDKQHAMKLTRSWFRQYILNNIYTAGDGALKGLPALDFKSPSLDIDLNIVS